MVLWRLDGAGVVIAVRDSGEMVELDLCAPKPADVREETNGH